MKELWDNIVDFFSSKYTNILLFFGILIIGILLVWLIISIIKAIFKKRDTDPLAARFITIIIRFSLLLILLLIDLKIVGVEITGLTTAISAVVLAIGMALKDSIAHLANGLIIVGSKKFKKGDYIIVSGVEGNIEDINLIFTTIKTFDSKRITMPNSTLVNNAVTNLGAYPLRRVDLNISVAYESDVELTKKIILDSINSCGLSYLDPKPFCRLKTLGDSSINFFANFWVDNEDYWEAYYTVLETIFNELKRNNVSIPFNQLEIRERHDNVVMPVIGDKIETRKEKVRTKKKEKFSFSKLEDMTIQDIIKEQNQKSKNKKDNKKENKATK